MIERFKEIVRMSPIATDKFINHCIGVYEILKQSGNREDVCNAGLYHSIYGTSYFDVTSQNAYNLNDRELIRKEIGEYAEDLVYKMCILPNREKTILSGNCDFSLSTYLDICKICKSNLIELKKSEGTNNTIEFDLFRYELLISYFNKKINPFLLENKLKNQVKVIDNLFPYHYHWSLDHYVKNSLFKPNHTSSKSQKYSDKTGRFVSYLSKKDFLNLDIFPYIKKIASDLGQDLFLKEYYIGCYNKSTYSDYHFDSSYSDTITILIYPNLYWEDAWAGDLKFYDDPPNSHFNRVIDFIPGRVVMFDSRIKHKVMPISSLAEMDRYSIAIKACFYSGLESFYEKDMNFDNMIYVSSS